MLLGDDVDVERNETALRAFFDYFELCEEELYYRHVGKVSSATWEEWSEGISVHFRRPAFIQAWEPLKGRVQVTNGDQDGGLLRRASAPRANKACGDAELQARPDTEAFGNAGNRGYVEYDAKSR